ncbi:MAG: hypothetical protein NVSMB1_19840 [Polyangiales bacterium]
MIEPISVGACKKIIRSILDTGTTRFSGHALVEMRKDNLTEVDCINVLRAGIAEPAEFENGS